MDVQIRTYKKKKIIHSFIPVAVVAKLLRISNAITGLMRYMSQKEQAISLTR
jgi:hypothetical protein